MTWIRGAWMLLVAAAAALALTAGASAAPKFGCPAGEWQELTVEQVAAVVWPLLIDANKELFGSEENFLDVAVKPIDKNGDGSICIKQIWGEDLNPNSAWYTRGPDGSPTVLTIPRDNNANGSK
jgi:hypothetical protein